MDETFIRERITQLRINRNISERSMSLDLGHSSSYVHSIVSGKALPSMSEFLYICEYFKITPLEFFDENIENPVALHEIVADLVKLDAKQIESLHGVVKVMGRRS